MTYEWKVSAVSEREMHQVFTASQIEARFPHIWTQEVVETEKAYAAPLKRHGNIIGIIGFDKDPDKPHHDSSQSVRLLGFLSRPFFTIGSSLNGSRFSVIQIP